LERAGEAIKANPENATDVVNRASRHRERSDPGQRQSPERILQKLKDFCDKNALRLFDSGAISYRSNDSVRAESALDRHVATLLAMTA
jgi:hypothetical protein